MTQEDLVSLTIFKIVVNAVVRVVLMEVCVPQEAHYIFGWAVGDHNGVFYADDSRIARHNPIWVQTTLAATVRMFESVGMRKNIGKTKAIVFNPGFIWRRQPI